MKKTLFFLVLTCLFTALIFTSCDSLWSVNGNVSIAFDLNLENYFNSYSKTTPRSIGVVPSDDDIFEQAHVVVSLHNSHDDSILASQKLSIEDAQKSSVAFDSLTQGQEVYAKIEVIDESEEDPGMPKLGFLFKARSLDTVLKKGENTLIAKPNALFLYAGIDRLGASYLNVPDTAGFGAFYPEYSIDDFQIEGAIYNEKTYTEVLKDCYDYMSINGTLLPDATVYVKDTIIIGDYEGEEIWNFPGLILKRAINTQEMISISSGQLTIKSITIDGNKHEGFIFSPPLDLGSYSVVNIAFGGTLIMEAGSLIQNNEGSVIYGSAIHLGQPQIGHDPDTLIMNGGTIIGNSTSNDEGGGVYMSPGSFFTMNGGTITGNMASNSANDVHVTEGANFDFKGGLIGKLVDNNP